MKKSLNIILVMIGLTIGLNAFSQQPNYKDGSVWGVSFIKTNANMGEQYLNSLKATWIAVHDEAVKQGLIVSYKVMSGAASNPGDWDIMLMTEYKNLASMEGQDAKWDAIYKKIVGNEEDSKKLNESRVNMRTIFGEKLLREVSYK
jgi:hypothetical protein